jgi:phosphate-selective porin OprO/OprP
MKKKILTKAALAALATAGGIAAVSSEANAQTAPTIQPMSGAPEIRDGQQRFKIRGRLQYDIYSADSEALGVNPFNTEDGTRSYVRRAFIGAQGRFSDNWRYKIDFVLNPGNTDDATTGSQDVALDDAYLEYAGDFYSVVIGQNNVTSPLEDRTSSLDIPFAERSSVINAFGYGRAMGVAGLITGANWMAAVGVYGDSADNSENFAQDEQASVSARFTWAPIFSTSPDGVTLLHLGVSARQRHAGDDSVFRYRPRPLNGRGSRHVETAANATENDTSYGFEVAGQWNAFGVTAEYITLQGETQAGPEAEYDGYYVDLTWSLTGEARPYRGNQGSFGPIVPAHPVTEGGWGHVGLSARYDFIDLTDPLAGASRGEQTAFAVGLNWVPVDHVRFMLNYASTDADRTAPGSVDGEADIFTLRTQFDF